MDTDRIVKTVVLKASRERDQRGNTADVVGGRGEGMIIRIELRENPATREFHGGLRIGRRERTAWSAPRSPDVDHDGDG